MYIYIYIYIDTCTYVSAAVRLEFKAGGGDGVCSLSRALQPLGWGWGYVTGMYSTMGINKGCLHFLDTEDVERDLHTRKRASSEPPKGKTDGPPEALTAVCERLMEWQFRCNQTQPVNIETSAQDRRKASGKKRTNAHKVQSILPWQQLFVERICGFYMWWGGLQCGVGSVPFVVCRTQFEFVAVFC